MVWPDGDGHWALRVGHTSSFGADDLRATRAALDEAFDGEFADSDWDHALGGIHAVVLLDGSVVGHASVVLRRLLHDGATLRARGEAWARACSRLSTR
jgi:aminoglycoside 2'-N-acetyltransferase I